MEFKRFELDELFDKIRKILQYVEENHLTDKNYTFFLANGETLKYKLTQDSIPHLLGIQTTYLVSSGIYSKKGSYSLLEEMLEDAYRIHNLALEGKIKYDQLFSEHIFKKLDCFKDNINIDIHEIDIVSKYIANRTYTVSETTEKFDYVITKNYPDNKIGLLCLVNNNGVLVPMSSQILETEKEKEDSLKNILLNQEITYINGIHTYTFDTVRSHISFDEQVERLEHLKNYKYKYNASIDVSKNCLYFIDKLKNNKNTFYQNNNTINSMVKSIRKGEIIEQIDSESELAPIVNAFNDFICNNEMGCTDATLTYTEQYKELERIRIELNELRRAKLILTDQVDILISQNNDLIGQVNKHEEKEKQLLKILRPEN